MKHMISLHKHWVVADAVKQVVMKQVDNDGSLQFPDALVEAAQFLSSFARLSVLYGLIYVVVEGYQELNCSDEAVDALLKRKEFVDALRLFRNATFHYQKEPVPEKLLKFLELPDSESWIRELHKALGKFFEKNLPIHEMLEQLKAEPL